VGSLIVAVRVPPSSASKGHEPVGPADLCRAGSSADDSGRV